MSFRAFTPILNSGRMAVPTLGCPDGLLTVAPAYHPRVGPPASPRAPATAVVTTEKHGGDTRLGLPSPIQPNISHIPKDVTRSPFQFRVSSALLMLLFLFSPPHRPTLPVFESPSFPWYCFFGSPGLFVFPPSGSSDGWGLAGLGTSAFLHASTMTFALVFRSQLLRPGT